jgi:acyl-CoA reductase-like NAD-dependent aldehyde dehydrogenase
MEHRKFGRQVALNETIYGLQAGVFCRDVQKVWQAIKRLDFGGVIINDTPTFRTDHMPYGGMKESGVGREGGRHAIEEMTHIKMVAFHVA